MTILVTGGAGFIGRVRVPPGCGRGPAARDPRHPPRGLRPWPGEAGSTAVLG
jgi:hypothetical protein